jgi:hypothetical protein
MNAVTVKEQAPLDELMLAMDVVDTLRHQELVLARELEADDRDAQLLVRLREIYAAQGIEVTDEVLEQGVRALREERFAYRGPEPSFGRTLATLYVTRARWGKPVVGGVALLAVAALAFQLFVRGPEQQAIADMPADLQGAYQGIVISTQNPVALDEARGLLAAGEAAVATRNYTAAGAAVANLRELGDRLQQQYEIRIVSRPGERSGVWRYPEDNNAAQNFYVIVEAVGPGGEEVVLPIVSEETGRTERVAKWGLRVDESTFNRVAADQRDDGIIQGNVAGVKRRGELDPAYNVATTGAAITEW